MEKIVVTENKPSLLYGALTNIASLGKPNLSKWQLNKELKNNTVQNSYKTNGLKTWTKCFNQKYINGVQTFIINENGPKSIVYFHGGAYISNPTIFHFNFLEKLAKLTGYKIYMVIYPRLPKYSCEESVRILEGWFNCLEESSVILGGDSSGGGLAIALCKYLKQNGLMNIEKVFALSPWMAPVMENPEIEKYFEKDLVLDFDYLKKTGSIWKGNMNENNYLHSPVLINDWGQIPLLILSGADEMLAPDIKKFCENNNNGNIMWYEYDKMQHVFTLYPCKEGRKSLSKVVDYLLNDNNS